MNPTTDPTPLNGEELLRELLATIRDRDARIAELEADWCGLRDAVYGQDNCPIFNRAEVERIANVHREQRNAATARAEQAERERDEHQTTILALKNQCDVSERGWKRVERERDEARAELSRLRAAVPDVATLATLRTQVRDLANKANALEGEKEELRKEVERLQVRKTTWQKRCESLLTEYAALRAQLDRAREGLTAIKGAWRGKADVNNMLAALGVIYRTADDLLAQLQPEQFAGSGEERCPKCGHASHLGHSCLSAASDNECDCDYGTATSQPEQKGPVNEPCPGTTSSDAHATAAKLGSNAAPAKSEPSQGSGNEFPMTHELKTDSAVFHAVKSGIKRFEIRLNDRNYKVGDTLLLRETKHTGAEMRSGAPLEYIGEPLRREVCHILHGPIYGLAEGWCIMSIAEPNPAPHPAASDTPLTDAAQVWVGNEAARIDYAFFVPADLARDLETKLRATEREMEQMQDVGQRQLEALSEQLDLVKADECTLSNIGGKVQIVDCPDVVKVSRSFIEDAVKQLNEAHDVRADLATANERAEKAEAELSTLKSK